MQTSSLRAARAPALSSPVSPAVLAALRRSSRLGCAALGVVLLAGYRREGGDARHESGSDHLTSSQEEEDVVRGYALGANAYVRKPVEFAEFAEFVVAARTLGFFWLLMNCRAPARQGP